MNTQCSIELLESALAGNLPSDDETTLHRHLEECEQCSAALERMAGGAAWCREAASLLVRDELDAALPGYPLAGHDEWSEVDFTVEHLEPTDEPNVLGRLGGYDVLEIIGRGGMGVVLKGYDRELKRCVAIKVLSPHLAQSSLAKKRFAREAQAAAAVVHPNVLAIHQVQPGGRLPFLVMPLVAGESLAQRLTAQGRLELKETLRIGMQAAAGLAAAHEQGLVHRDVKPANILLEKGVERAVLTDFGLARAADDVALTRWGIIAGTPQYMSPEQARGEPLDGRSDLFSLGCVLYEMVTGVSPFRTDSVMATMRRLVDDPPQAMASLNPELPPWFVGIVERLLEKDPSRRFNSAKEVSELLEGCLAHLQQPGNVPLPAALPKPAPHHAWRPPAIRFKGVIAMIAALGAGLLGFLLLSTAPPDIAGQWSGEDWGQIVLKKTNDAEYTGTYSDTVGKQPGEIQLKWSRIERRFNGTWHEGEDRFGELSVRLVGDEIRGALTTDAKCKINPATPRLGDLAWTRAVSGVAAITPRPPLLQHAESAKLSPSEIEAYVLQNNRSKESLLAAFRVSGNRAFLEEAVTRFPSNPAVQCAILAHNTFPDQRRKWIDEFKTSAPDNALACYFSALDYFKKKRTDLATQELKEATRRPTFTDYQSQTTQAVEEMHRLAGRPLIVAKQEAALGVEVLHLGQLRDLSREMLQLHEQYRQQGDTASANTMAGMGVVLGRHLSMGANSHFIVNQLVGISIEKQFLKLLDPSTKHEILDRSVGELAAEVQHQSQAIKDVTQLIARLLPTLDETELANYFDRLKLYGETEALTWLQSKHGSEATTSNQAVMFGPVIERTLNPTDRQHDRFLDLDTGKLFDLPDPKEVKSLSEGGNIAEIKKWAAGRGIDLLADEVPVGLGLVVFPRSNNRGWDEPPVGDLLSILKQAEGATPAPMMPGKDLPATYYFKTREGAMGVLQITGFVEKKEPGQPRGVKIRYKLLQGGSAIKAISDATPVLLAEQPQLRFLAWQDEYMNEYETSQQRGVFRADGSAVTDPADYRLLRSIAPTRCDASGTAEGKGKNLPFLHLWFSHPLVDQQSINEVTLLDDAGTPVSLGGGGTVGWNARAPKEDRIGHLGWLTYTLSPRDVPATVTVRLRYSVGPWKEGQQFKPDERGIIALGHGSQFNGVGQDLEGKAFFAIAVDMKQDAERQFGVMAVTKDGHELQRSVEESGGGVGEAIRVQRFVFATSLADISHFRLGTRPIRTVEFQNIATHAKPTAPAAERLGDSKDGGGPEKMTESAVPIDKLPDGAAEHLESLIERGMLDDALTAYRRLPIPSLLTRLGTALKRDGRGLEMLDLYKGFLLSVPTGTVDASAGPGDSSPLGLAGGVIGQIVEVGAGDDAAKWLSEHLAGQPREAWLHLRLGYLWWKTGQRDKALVEFDHYTTLWEKPSGVWMGWLAQLCVEAGLTDKAIAYYQRALKIPITAGDLRAAAMRFAMYRPPEYIRSEIKADLLFKLGELFRKQKQWPEAERCYLDILGLDPPNGKVAAEVTLAAIWKVMGKDNTLIAQLRKQLANAPDKAEVHAELARLLMATGKTEEGIEHYRAAVKLAPEQLGYLLKLADVLANAGKDEEAVAQYAAALKAAILLPPPQGRGVDQVTPLVVLSRLERYFLERKPSGGTPPSPALQESLIKLYRDVLHNKQWTPSEYTLRTLLENMTTILAARSDYDGIVALWLDHRKVMQFHAREKVRENMSRLNSLEGLIAKLRQAVRDDSADVCGRLILGDALLAAGQKQSALEVYDELSRSRPGDERLHIDLAATYAKMEEIPRVMAEYRVVLRNQPVGSKPYVAALGYLGWASLRAGKKEQATECFREALKFEPLNADYQRGLRQAGGAASTPQPNPVAEVSSTATTLRRAEDLLAKGKLDEAIPLCRQFLDTHPTHVEAMVLLARTYLKAGRESEAVAAFESAHRLRRWTSTNYDTMQELERIYLKTGADEKLVALYSDNRQYRQVQDFYRQRKHPEQFERYLQRQLEKTPGDVDLRFFTAEDDLDNQRVDLARRTLEQLRAELDWGMPVSAERLADGFERLREPAAALKLLEAIDFARRPDHNDWLGQRLMRLYSATGQMPKALETCLLRLRKDPDGHHTLKIADEIASQALAAKDGRRLLEAFLKEQEGGIPAKVVRRFTGAVMAHLRADATPREDSPVSIIKDPVSALKKGRVVHAPPATGTLLDFLDALAGHAETAVDQSFRSRAASLPAPKVSRTDAPAFELLAEALSGLPATLEMTEQGYWAVFERGDRAANTSFGAAGGVICTLDNGSIFRSKRGRLAGMGHLHFDPEVKPNVVGTAMSPRILEASDDRGRDIAIPSGISEPIFDPIGMLTFGLRNLDPPSKTITKLRLAADVAVCTNWITLTSAPLDGDQPVVLKDPSVTVTVAPLQTVESAGKKSWQIHVVHRWSKAPAGGNAGAMRRPRIHFLTDGKTQLPGGISDHSTSPDVGEFDVHVAVDSFARSHTQLVVALPNDVQVVPVELSFKNIPIMGASD